MKTSSKTVIRAATPADYPVLVALNKASYPDYGETEEEWRHWDETWDHKKYFKSRVVAEDDGRVVGFGLVNHMRWAFVPTKYRIDITVHPDHRERGHGSALYDALLDKVSERSGRAVAATVKESMVDGVRFLTKRGFREVKRDWESRLFVEGFDFARFAAAEARVAKQGIRIATLAEEMQRDSSALRKAFELNEDCRMDIPSVDPPTRHTLEEFRREDIDAPSALLDAFFVAIDKDGRYLGVSNLFRSLDDPAFLWQGITGVRREARGKGIAMALKLLTVRYAIDKGVEHIKTWNDVHNRAMLAINEAMGFVKQPPWISYEKDL
ncbi:MAG TPA: GNAT family N-acetyltransferase [Verrucomicrobiae bacterium]|nr:GNAT family N-acetyltransferase [Verrucomicrobiae bacterium]